MVRLIFMIDKFSKELNEAMKAKDTVKVIVLRGLISELKNRLIDLRAEGKELTDDESMKVIAKEAKKRKDSIEAYKSAGREDLVQEESLELSIIEEYLPKGLSNEDISLIVDEVLSTLGNNAQFGAIMGAVMSKVAGRADGNLVREVVNAKIKG